MQHPDENMIEAFVLARDPASDRLTAVRDHLNGCPACRQVADFLRTMNAEISAEIPEPSQRVLHFIRSISSPPNVIKLTPFEPRHRDQTRENEPIILAAHSPEQKMRFRRVATLVSADDSILLRIVYDGHDGVYRISLQRATPSQSPVIVRFPNWQKTGVIPALGQTEIRMDEEPEGLPHPEAEVHMPAAEIDVEIDLAADRFLVTPLSGDTTNIQCSLEAREILVAQGDSKESPRFHSLVVFGNTNVPQLHELRSSAVQIAAPENESRIRLSFFT